MPSCSCPHCGRKNIPFEMHEAESVLQCAKCNGFFTPLGGKVEYPKLAECTPIEHIAHSLPVAPEAILSEPRQRLRALSSKRRLPVAPEAILSEPFDSPLFQKAVQFLNEDESIWVMIPGRALEKITEIHTKGGTSGIGIGFDLGGGIGVGVGSTSTSGRSKIRQTMEMQGGWLTHYLIVTDGQLIFWMRGILSEKADQIDISSLRGIERQQQHRSTVLTFHLEFGDKYFATPSKWAEQVQPILRKLIRKSHA